MKPVTANFNNSSEGRGSETADDTDEEVFQETTGVDDAEEDVVVDESVELIKDELFSGRLEQPKSKQHIINHASTECLFL